MGDLQQGREREDLRLIPFASWIGTVKVYGMASGSAVIHTVNTLYLNRFSLLDASRGKKQLIAVFMCNEAVVSEKKFTSFQK